MDRTALADSGLQLFSPHPVPAPIGERMLRRLPRFRHSNAYTISIDAPKDADNLFGPDSQTQQLVQKLDDELTSMRERPGLVVFPASNLPWAPQAPIDARTLRFVRLLAAHEIIAGLTCRSVLSDEVIDQLCSVGQWVRISIPVLSADVSVQKALEPHSAMLTDRLQLVRALKGRGIQVQVAVEPIIPNLTDSREAFEPLIEKIAAIGIDSISAGYLYLRPGQKDDVQRVLEPHGWSELVLSAYSEALVIREPGEPQRIFLSKSRRQRGYALLMSIAAEHGLATRLSFTSNPDFQPRQAPDAAGSARFQAFIRSLRRRPR